MIAYVNHRNSIKSRVLRAYSFITKKHAPLRAKTVRLTVEKQQTIRLEQQKRFLHAQLILNIRQRLPLLILLVKEEEEEASRLPTSFIIDISSQP